MTDAFSIGHLLAPGMGLDPVFEDMGHRVVGWDELGTCDIVHLDGLHPLLQVAELLKTHSLRLVIWSPSQGLPPSLYTCCEDTYMGPTNLVHWERVYERLMKQPKRFYSWEPEIGRIAASWLEPRARRLAGDLLLEGTGGTHSAFFPKENGLSSLEHRPQDAAPDVWQAPYGLDAFKDVADDPLIAYWQGIELMHHQRWLPALARLVRAIKLGFCHYRVCVALRTCALSLASSNLYQTAIHFLRKHASTSTDFEHDFRRAGFMPLRSTDILAPDIWHPSVIQPNDHHLLQALTGWTGLERIHTVHLAGAHLFAEASLLWDLLPAVKTWVLYEPNPELFAQLQSRFKNDAHVYVFPYALSDRDGEAELNISSNQGLSSSLLPLGSHKDASPDVSYVDRIRVPCRTLDSVIQAHHLPAPDFLFLDIQGAEYQVISSLSSELRLNIQLLFTETSTTEVYQGAKTLDAIVENLGESFSMLGFTPIAGHGGRHGNALFLHERSLGFKAQEEETPSADVLLTDTEIDALMRFLQQYLLSRKQALLGDADWGKRSCLIWGAGGMGRALFAMLEALNIPVDGFLDSNARDEGHLCGVPIYPVSHLKGKEPKPYVMVGSSYRDEICQELASLGFEPQQDYLVPDPAMVV